MLYFKQYLLMTLYILPSELISTIDMFDTLEHFSNILEDCPMLVIDGFNIPSFATNNTVTQSFGINNFMNFYGLQQYTDYWTLYYSMLIVKFRGIPVL